MLVNFKEILDENEDISALNENSRQNLALEKGIKIALSSLS